MSVPETAYFFIFYLKGKKWLETERNIWQWISQPLVLDFFSLCLPVSSISVDQHVFLNLKRRRDTFVRKHSTKLQNRLPVFSPRLSDTLLYGSMVWLTIWRGFERACWWVIDTKPYCLAPRSTQLWAFRHLRQMLHHLPVFILFVTDCSLSEKFWNDRCKQKCESETSPVRCSNIWWITRPCSGSTVPY